MSPGYIVEVVVQQTEMVAAPTIEDALAIAEAKSGGEAVCVTPIAHCPRCGGFADLSETYKRHAVPGCLGRWDVPVVEDTAVTTRKEQR